MISTLNFSNQEGGQQTPSNVVLLLMDETENHVIMACLHDGVTFNHTFMGVGGPFQAARPSSGYDEADKLCYGILVVTQSWTVAEEATFCFYLGDHNFAVRNVVQDPLPIKLIHNGDIVAEMTRQQAFLMTIFLSNVYDMGTYPSQYDELRRREIVRLQRKERGLPVD